VIVISHNAVSNAFKLVAALAFLPVMFTIAHATPSRRDFKELVAPDARHDERVLVSWPNGWHRHLSVNTAPFEGGAGRVGGAVAAFVEREPSTGTVR